MLAGGIIASKWFVKMEGTMNEQSIALNWTMWNSVAAGA